MQTEVKTCTKYQISAHGYMQVYKSNQHTVPRVIIVVVRTLVRAQVPQLDGLVLGRGRDHEAVRREDGGAHPVDVAAVYERARAAEQQPRAAIIGCNQENRMQINEAVNKCYSFPYARFWKIKKTYR